MKTNMSPKWYQSKAYDLLYCRRIFKKNILWVWSLLNLKKQFSASYKTLEWCFWIDWRALINCLMPYCHITYNSDPVEWRYGIYAIP
jgi:hypothetical protein